MKNKNVKKNALAFKKKALTELQKQENTALNGGQDTEYKDFEKFLDAFKDIELPR